MTSPATGLPPYTARPSAATRMTADRAALILAAFAPAEMCAASLLRNTNQDIGTSPRGLNTRQACDAAGVRAHRRWVRTSPADKGEAVNIQEGKQFAELLTRLRAGAQSDSGVKLDDEECEILTKGIDALRVAVEATATARDEGERYGHSSIGFRLLAERSQGEADGAVAECLDLLEQIK